MQTGKRQKRLRRAIIMDADGSSTSEEFHAARHTLCRNIKFYPRNRSLLNPEDLEVLYRHRQQFTPSRDELKLIFSSMRKELSKCTKYRQYDLGWYWFRNISQTEFFSLLMEMAREKNPLVRWPAVNLLGFFRFKKAFKLFKTLVKDQADEVAWEAVKGLARYPAECVIPLFRRMSFNVRLDPKVRGKAAAVLASLNGPDVVSLIERFADDGSESIRLMAVGLMTQSRRPYDELLRKLARDRSGRVRRAAMVALAKLGRDADRKWIVEIAKNKSNPNQHFAVSALAEFADPRDFPLMSALIKDSLREMASVAAYVLWRYPCQEAANLLGTLVADHKCWPAISSLVRLPAKLTVKTIREFAKNTNDILRSNLAFHLRDWNHPDARKIIRQLARDRDYGVRSNAASTLGILGVKDDLPLLRKMCRDENEWVRQAAVWSVGKFREPSDIPLLKRLVLDSCVEVGVLAARRLAAMASRKDLSQWLDANIEQLSFDTLKELDYVLYAPRWLRKAEEIANDDKSLSLMCVG
jgi:HEAT repeat protein